MDLKQLIISFGIIFGVLLVIILLGIREEKARNARFLKNIRKKYGKKNVNSVSLNKLNIVKGYFLKHKSEDSIDDITWTDLSMDKIYESMNNTYSSAGEEYLYYLLRTPKFNLNELKTLDNDIEYFSSNDNFREKVLMSLKDIGKLNNYSIYDYLNIKDSIKDKCKDTLHIILLLLFILSIGLIFIKTGAGIICTVLMVIINVSVYFKKKSYISGYLVSLKYIMRLYYSLLTIRKENGIENINNDKLAILDESIKGLNKFSKYSKLVFASLTENGSVFDMLLSYINMVLHLDIIMFNHMIRIVFDKKDSIDNLVSFAGYLDAVIAVASYRECFKESYSKPVFDDNFTAQSIYHPLLTKPVSNDYIFEKNVLITGSNASGKSTFLRTVAINQLLAQTIYTSLAKEFHTGFFRLYSSMSLRDDIIKGDSYFMAEIKSLKRILEGNCNPGIKILCFVDELLRGTNTIERIAACAEVLKYFSNNGIKCFAATHDIELTDILSAYYDNYHFEEDFHDGDIHFSYKIKDGAAKSRNAIRLLEGIGYDENIVSNANILADNFIKTGVWTIES